MIKLCRTIRSGSAFGVYYAVDKADAYRARIEDGRAPGEPRALPAGGDRVERRLPEALLVDVLEGDEGVRIELGLVETAERDLTIVLLVSDTGDLVRGDGIGDEAGLSKGFDGGQGLLLRESLCIAYRY